MPIWFSTRVGALELANIMIVCPTRASRPSPHCFRCRFRQVAHKDAVVVGAWRFQHHPAQQGMVQLDSSRDGRGRNAKQALK